MGADPSDGCGRTSAAEGVNLFALVIYIQGQLGIFLDDLRRELIPQCNPHAHVSVLPPRPLATSWQSASMELREWIEEQAAFDVELTEIHTFGVTDVVYIEVGAGARELTRLHAALNTGSFAYREPFPYCPHITVAQEIPSGQVAAIREIALRRWAEYRGPRTFRAERVTLVQNTTSGGWIDLAGYRLAAVTANL